MRTPFVFFTLPHINKSHLSLLYTINSLRTFMFAFFSLLLPIILLQQFSIFPERTAVFYTILFFVLHTIVQLLFLEAAAHIVARYGFRVSFIFGLFFLLLFFLFLELHQLTLAVITFGIATVQWWYTYHLVFIETGKLRQFGREVGTSEALYILIGSVAPIMGAFIMQKSGAGGVYVFAALLIATAMILTLFFKGGEPNDDVTFGEMIQQIKKRKREFVAFVGAGSEETIHTIIWPILLYYVFQDVMKVAAFSSIIIILAIVAEYVVGLSSDKYDRTKLEKVGSLFMFISWTGKAVFPQPFMLGGFDLIHRLFNSFFVIPLRVIAYRHAMHEKEKYIAFREVAIKVGNLVALATFGIIVASGLPYWFIFIFAAFYSLLPSQVRT